MHSSTLQTFTAVICLYMSLNIGNPTEGISNFISLDLNTSLNIGNNQTLDVAIEQPLCIDFANIVRRLWTIRDIATYIPHIKVSVHDENDSGYVKIYFVERLPHFPDEEIIVRPSPNPLVPDRFLEKIVPRIMPFILPPIAAEYNIRNFSFDIIDDNLYDNGPTVGVTVELSDGFTLGDCKAGTIDYNENYSQYTITCTGPNPSYISLVDSETNNIIRQLDLNLPLREFLATMLMPEIRFMTVSLGDGSMAFVKLQLPPGIDDENSLEKYPMIVHVKGVANSMSVTNEFGIDIGTYLATTRRIIYVQIDGRATLTTNSDILNQLHEVELEDQIYVTKYLQNNLQHVDVGRTGVWGWGYGGHIAVHTLASLDGVDIFKCGISMAPGITWLGDTELDIGSFDDLMNIANNSPLLIHDPSDDDLNYQYSLRMQQILNGNGVLFDEWVLAGEGLFMQLELYETMDNFWINCFNL